MTKRITRTSFVRHRQSNGHPRIRTRPALPTRTSSLILTSIQQGQEDGLTNADPLWGGEDLGMRLWAEVDPTLPKTASQTMGAQKKHTNIRSLTRLSKPTLLLDGLGLGNGLGHGCQSVMRGRVQGRSVPAVQGADVGQSNGHHCALRRRGELRQLASIPNTHSTQPCRRGHGDGTKPDVGSLESLIRSFPAAETSFRSVSARWERGHPLRVAKHVTQEFETCHPK